MVMLHLLCNLPAPVTVQKETGPAAELYDDQKLKIFSGPNKFASFSLSLQMQILISNIHKIQHPRN